MNDTQTKQCIELLGTLGFSYDQVVRGQYQLKLVRPYLPKGWEQHQKAYKRQITNGLILFKFDCFGVN